jgi:hypothetical protein
MRKNPTIKSWSLREVKKATPMARDHSMAALPNF